MTTRLNAPRPSARLALGLVCVQILSVSCARRGDLDPSRRDLERVLASHRTAHLNLDARMLASSVADSLVSVDAGTITVQTREDVERMFAAYFAGATYREWEDTEPPRIALSPDGRLAWVIRRVRVDREAAAPGGGRRREQFVSAYTSTFERMGATWKMTSVTSTLLPPDSAAAG